MAAVKIQYQGYVESIDIAEVKRNLYGYPLRPNPSEGDLANFFNHNPDLLTQVNQIVEFNASSASTVAAVNVAYTGTTNAERIAWINERLKAIESRADFVKARADILINNLKELGSTGAGDIFLGLWGAAFSIAVPVFGSLLSSVFVGGYKNASADTIADQQTKLQTYSADIQQLSGIKAALAKELAELTANDPTSNAPFVVPTWWYFVGAGLLLLLVVWYRRRTTKRRKR